MNGAARVEESSAQEDELFQVKKLFGRTFARKKEDYKSLQLCRQVYRALTLALAGEADEVLQNLTVESVTSAPGGGRLMVKVCAVVRSEPSEIADVYERLGRAHGRLRREVVQSIVRKRAPELIFVVGSAEVRP